MIQIFRLSEKTEPEKMPNLVQHSLWIDYPEEKQKFLDFERQIAQLAEKMRLPLADYQIDHLALRVNSQQSAKYWLTLLSQYSTILSDNIVNGRSIYLLELSEPLMLLGQCVQIIELPFPKNKCYPQEGWEHIEVVIPFLVNENTEQWITRIEKQFQWNQFPILNIKISEPKAERDQLPNPSIAISFLDKKNNSVCIKVHPYHIKNIIEV